MLDPFCSRRTRRRQATPLERNEVEAALAKGHCVFVSAALVWLRSRRSSVGLRFTGHKAQRLFSLSAILPIDAVAILRHNTQRSGATLSNGSSHPTRLGRAETFRPDTRGLRQRSPAWAIDSIWPLGAGSCINDVVALAHRIGRLTNDFRDLQELFGQGTCLAPDHADCSRGLNTLKASDRH